MKYLAIGVTIGVLVGIGLSYALLAQADTIIYVAVEEPKIEIKELDIDEEISKKATEYGVDGDTMRRVIQCESNGSTTIQSRHFHKGKQEESYGLAQINLPSWPTITMDQALDPVFSIDFLAKKLSEGRGDLWTCFRNLKSS